MYADFSNWIASYHPKPRVKPQSNINLFAGQKKATIYSQHSYIYVSASDRENLESAHALIDSATQTVAASIKALDVFKDDIELSGLLLAANLLFGYSELLNAIALQNVTARDAVNNQRGLDNANR